MNLEKVKKLDEEVESIKEDVAKAFGYTLEMPTIWNYAMLMTYRTKRQLQMYEEVIRRVQLKNL